MNLSIQHNEVAAWLAHQNSEVQAEFLAAFLKELAFVCETHYKTELQLVQVAIGLRPAHRELLAMLAPEQKP